MADQSDCEHKFITKEVMFGQKTGDRVCVDCGKVFYPGEAEDDRKAAIAAGSVLKKKPHK